MKSNLKNLFINSDAVKKIVEESKINNSTPYKRKDVKIDTSSKSKVKLLGRRDN